MTPYRALAQRPELPRGPRWASRWARWWVKACRCVGLGLPSDRKVAVLYRQWRQIQAIREELQAMRRQSSSEDDERRVINRYREKKGLPLV